MSKRMGGGGYGPSTAFRNLVWAACMESPCARYTVHTAKQQGPPDEIPLEAGVQLPNGTGTLAEMTLIDEGDVCGICQVLYEGCCPFCKMPGDD